jgi:hypothetical protein
MQQLETLRSRLSDPSLPPKTRAELRLLLNIYDPEAYRQELARKLLRRGRALIQAAASARDTRA